MRRAVFVVVIAACSAPTRDPGAGDAPAVDAAPPSGFTDFPAHPIEDPSLPANVQGLFVGGTDSGGPCLAEPELGSLFPHNWIRPRFSWVPTGDENLFELTVETAGQAYPLVVYTAATTWTMPEDMWTGLQAHAIDQPITVRVRGATFDGMRLTSGPALGASGAVSIAPVEAPGRIVYWTGSYDPMGLPAGVELRSLAIGEEPTADLVTVAEVAVEEPSTTCIGCHRVTPDGAYVALASENWNGALNPVAMRTLDGTNQEPPYLTQAAFQMLDRRVQTELAFSPMHDQPGDRLLVSMFEPKEDKHITVPTLIWTDLEATSSEQGVGWDTVKINGRPAFDVAWPAFANTSDTMIFGINSLRGDGSDILGEGDLATVPFNHGAGGTPTLVPGASTVNFDEFYPAFSPDDRYIAYARVPAGEWYFNEPDTEVLVIPAAGGNPTRIAANDPVACGAPKHSPGVTNSWPQWAPATSDLGGKRYSWLVFSSSRIDAPDGVLHPQLFVTPIVDDGAGHLTTYPALNPWNQPAGVSNHTPAWVPGVPSTMPPPR